MSAEAREIDAGNAADVAGKPRRAGGRARLLTLADLDRRTGAAQAAIELRDRLVSERGGEANLNALRLAMLDSVAVLTAMIRDTEVRWLKGEPVDPSALATLLNARRREAELVGLDPKALDVTPSLQNYLKQKATGESAEATE